MTLLQHHILALSLTAATTFILGLLVFLAEPKRRLNQIFGLYSLSIAWWATFEALAVGVSQQTTAISIAYFEWAGVIFIGPTFLHTVALLIGDSKKSTRLILRFSYAIGFFLVVLHFGFRAVVETLRPVSYVNFFTKLTPIGYVIPILFAFLVNLALWKLWKAYRTTSGRRKIPLKYLFWASVVGYIGGSPDWFMVFGFSVPFFNPFGVYGVPLYSIATTYTVLQHRLFDFNLVIRKSLIYSILITMLTAGYFGIIYGIESIFRTTLGYRSWAISLSGFALMALLFQPLKLAIQRFIDWLIFRVPQEELIRRIERLEQGVHDAEKLKAVATMAAGLCHELRNPLQIIQTHAEFLPDRYDDPAFREQCKEAMRTETIRINALLKELMEFAKPKPAKMQSIEPHPLLDSTLNLLNADFLKHEIQLEKEYLANGAQVLADPDQIRQVILNLALNAIEAIGQSGKITVKTSQDGVWFTLEITDTGPGIDPKILSRLFQPFSTTKENGNGLGLSVAHSIIESHRGRIFAENKSDKGSCFTVKLPLD